MKRHLFNVAAAVSLVLCVGVVAACAYGHTRNSFYVHAGSTIHEFRSIRHKLYYAGGTQASPGGEWDVPYLNSQDLNVQQDWSFALRHVKYPPGNQIWVVMVPYWLLILLTAVLPTIWLVLILRHRRRVRAGACLNCGYDLRATPDRCPECGTVPSAH